MRRNIIVAMLATVAMPIAFENKAGWKLDADGKIELKDGNPVYVKEDGSESTVDGVTISRLNAEAKTHREGKEAAEAIVAKYRTADGKLIDPETAIKAIDTVNKIDLKKLIDSGEVDKVRDQIKAEFTAQIAEKDKTIGDLTGRVDTMTIDNVFNDDFVRNDIAVPGDMFRSYFGKNFKVEDGKIKAFGPDGNPLLSKEKLGEMATPQEALRLLVDMHPQKDTLLKAAPAGGSGGGGGGGNRGGGRVMKRAEFDALNPVQQGEIATKVGSGEMSLVD